MFDLSFRTSVADSTKGVVTRAETLACKLEREQVNVYWDRFSPFGLTGCYLGCPKSHHTKRAGNRSHSQKSCGHLDESRQFNEDDGDLCSLVLESCTSASIKHHAIPVRH
jgi:hypothetical protein